MGAIQEEFLTRAAAAARAGRVLAVYDCHCVTLKLA
jgi:hypothetical protein